MATTATDFLPGLIAVERTPPHPAARATLWLFLGLFAAVLLWTGFGTLDIVASAEGKLIPSTYLKIVQPSEAGIVKDILVQEGQSVTTGQVLVRMDAVVSEADRKSILNEYQTKRLALRRIDAQLSYQALGRDKDDPADLYAQTAAQFNANRLAYEGQLAQERSTLEKAQHDLAAALQVQAKLEQVLPHYRNQEAAYEKLGKDGFAGNLMVTDKTRERIEREQDLKTQSATISAARATISEAEQRLRQVGADYRRNLQAERTETATQYEKLRQELAKQQHRAELLELKAPQAGFVKDLATHTPGTVVQPGTILMTLVPKDENLKAEVFVANPDVGFVRETQGAKIKLAAYPFQKYGMLEGRVVHVSADAQDKPENPPGQSDATQSETTRKGLIYRTLVELDTQKLVADGRPLTLTPGMQVTAEINLGTRSVMEYLLSPVQKAFHEAGRER
jgi:HlyD family secretion protein